MDASARHGGAADDAPGPVARAAAGLVEQLLGQLSDRALLLQLELRRAAGALAVVLALGFAGAILAATAWVALCGLGAWFALQQGVGMAWTVAGVVALNLLLCWAAISLAVRLLGAIGVPLTLQHLTRRGTREARAAAAQAGWAS